jgi:hypothetical protein
MTLTGFYLYRLIISFLRKQHLYFLLHSSSIHFMFDLLEAVAAKTIRIMMPDIIPFAFSKFNAVALTLQYRTNLALKKN